jgi:hypothetical protein
MAIVEPASMTRTASPGARLTQDFVVNVVPDGSLVATVSGGDSMIRLVDLIAYKLEQRSWTDEELAGLPPDARERARQEGYTERIEVGRVQAGQPLAVRSGLFVQGVIEFTAVQGAQSVTGTLIVEGSPGERVEVPLLLVVGRVQVEFLVAPIVGVRGESVPVPVKVSLSGGAPTNEIAISSSDPGITISSHAVSVPGNGSADTTLQLHADPFSPLGPKPGQLWVKGFFDHIETVPFHVIVARRWSSAKGCGLLPDGFCSHEA